MKVFTAREKFEDHQALIKLVEEVGEVPCQNYPDAYFPDSDVVGNVDDTQLALGGCSICPIKAACAEYGIRHANLGIYGGLMPRKRREIRKALGYAKPTDETLSSLERA